MKKWKHSTVLACALLTLPVLLSSCAFRRLKADVKTWKSQWSLAIRIDPDKHIEGDIVTVVYTPYKDAQRVAAFKIVDPTIQKTFIILEPGVYRLAVFHDRNRNLVIDSDEPVELYDRGRRLKFSDVQKRIDVELRVPEAHSLPKGYPRELASLPESLSANYHIAVGDIMNLDDPRFSKAVGRMGLWEPTRFLKEYGAGIYMLEAFDPDKTPVLFINGAGGSAQNWRYFFERLDKTRFQAWFFLYPSGMRIPRVGQSLNNILRQMVKKYPVQRIHMVAHSMGGLVGREALVNHLGDGEPLLFSQFVTLSTPWNGHRMAKRGVDALSTPIPSWHDVVPGSQFLQTVFRTPLKPKIAHHLLFGYVVGSDKDGSVALNSVLLNEAQDDAAEVRGFETDHVGILSLDLAFEYVENILFAAEEAAVSKAAAPPCPDTSAEGPVEDTE